MGSCSLTHTKLGCVAKYTSVSGVVRGLRVTLLSNPPVSGFNSCLCTKLRCVARCTNASSVVHNLKVHLLCPHPPVSGLNSRRRTGVRKSVASNLSGTTSAGSARTNHTETSGRCVSRTHMASSAVAVVDVLLGQA